jgi:hypothetical protein
MNMRVQYANTLLEDTLLVEHGDRDIQDWDCFEQVIHVIKPGVQCLMPAARTLGSACERTAISEQTHSVLSPHVEWRPLESRMQET